MNHEYVLSRSYRSACEQTPEVLTIAQMFGIGVDQEHEMVLYQDLKIRLGPGRVVYITGESGGGKTSLLRDTADAAKGDFNLVPAELEFQQHPLVNLFSALNEATELLSYAGIAEAFVMLRKPQELSDGQRYRLMLARAMAVARTVERPLICMDEFLANLDRETARGVARQVRKVATKSGICFVVATTHADIFEDLNPNQRITMRLGKPPESESRVV